MFDQHLPAQNSSLEYLDILGIQVAQNCPGMTKLGANLDVWAGASHGLLTAGVGMLLKTRSARSVSVNKVFLIQAQGPESGSLEPNVRSRSLETLLSAIRSWRQENP